MSRPFPFLAVVYQNGGKESVRDIEQLSLELLMPYNSGLPRGHLVVVLKCYFDSGNQSDSTQYDVVTLAALAGTFYEWKPFEKAWKNNLRKHGATWLHTTDAVAMNTPFSKRDGWTRDKVNSFIKDCAKIAGQFIARPITEEDPAGRIGIYPFSVTIDLKDYVRARADAEGVPNSVDEVLATQSINALFLFGQNFGGTKHFDLVYDQNEPFRGHILDRQRSPKVIKELPMFSRIVSNTEANMRFVPALQLADLWAWCVCHEKEEHYEWQKKLLSHPRDYQYGSYDQLISPIPRAVELKKQWKLPQRKLTR
jgi:hypothetical protein